MSGQSLHVMRNINRGWDVWRQGALRASKHFDSEAEAVEWGKDKAINKAIELYIHTWDGKVSEKLSEGLVHEHMVTCPIYTWDIDLETGVVQGEENYSTKKYETKVEEGVVYLLL